ncbi:hypothetical protein FPOA_11390 [Fusarium poae]|uniref:Uncharacterized protein n=1 Tax=Fusarium poae TaxID=36050 RepID=A0A1B8AGR4_FUSPO|nr:hypothetical protein FPOA_11390 [Fusarium poae]
MPNAPQRHFQVLLAIMRKVNSVPSIFLQTNQNVHKPNSKSGQPVFTDLTISSRVVSCVFAIWQRYASITACLS